MPGPRQSGQPGLNVGPREPSCNCHRCSSSAQPTQGQMMLLLQPLLRRSSCVALVSRETTQQNFPLQQRFVIASLSIAAHTKGRGGDVDCPAALFPAWVSSEDGLRPVWGPPAIFACRLQGGKEARGEGP